jgi:hypothetical protein
MRKPLTAPVELDCSDSRVPVVSVMSVAVTPALAALILSRTLASVSSAVMVTSTGVVSDFWVNVVPLH